MSKPFNPVFAHKTRDVALKVVSKCGNFRICAVNTTKLLQTTIDNHNLHEMETPALDLMGTTISFTNILASLLQGEERVECKFHANFDCSFSCESLALGECRACMGNSTPGAMQNVLSVRRVLYNNSDPVLSATLAEFEEVLPEDRYHDTFLLMGDAQSRAERFVPSAARHAQSRFNLNLTPHAFHYFKQSEGIPSAVLLTTSVEDDYSHLTTSGANGGAEASSPQSPRKRVAHSVGVIIQPLALDMDKENKIPLVIDKLQDLFNAIALCPAPPTLASVAHTALGIRASEEGVLVQDVLSLISGDYVGAKEVAAAARLMASDDVETVQLQYQPIRGRYGLKAVGEEGAVPTATPDESNKPVVATEAVQLQTAIPLDTTSVTRTALDFFCRCSAESITSSFTAMPVEDRKDLIGKTAGCVYCGKEYVLAAKHMGLNEDGTEMVREGVVGAATPTANDAPAAEESAKKTVDATAEGAGKTPLNG